MQAGFQTEEIGSIEVGGETWRRLKVTFPDNIKSHTREQISCLADEAFLEKIELQDRVLLVVGTYEYEPSQGRWESGRRRQFRRLPRRGAKGGTVSPFHALHGNAISTAFGCTICFREADSRGQPEGFWGSVAQVHHQ